MAIHAVTTKPFEVQAAVWTPTDPINRALVLAWLQDSLGEDEVTWAHHPSGVIYIEAYGQDLAVMPGEAIVFNPATGSLTAFSRDVFEATFDYSHTLIDPDQYVTVQHPRVFAGIDPASGSDTLLVFEVVGV